MAVGVSWLPASCPALLDAVAVFPGEVAAGWRAEGFLDNVTGLGWWVPVLGAGEAPWVVGVLGEAVKEPVDGSSGVGLGQASVDA